MIAVEHPLWGGKVHATLIGGAEGECGSNALRQSALCSLLGGACNGSSYRPGCLERGKGLTGRKMAARWRA